MRLVRKDKREQKSLLSESGYFRGSLLWGFMKFYRFFRNWVFGTSCIATLLFDLPLFIFVQHTSWNMAGISSRARNGILLVAVSVVVTVALILAITLSNRSKTETARAKREGECKEWKPSRRNDPRESSAFCFCAFAVHDIEYWKKGTCICGVAKHDNPHRLL